MAGLMFVVCVPTGAHEKNLTENSQRKSVSSTFEDLTHQTNSEFTNSLKKNSVNDENASKIFQKHEFVQQEPKFEKRMPMSSVVSKSKLDKQISVTSAENKSRFEQQLSWNSLDSKSDLNLPSIVITIDGNDVESEGKLLHQEEPSRTLGKKSMTDKVSHHEGELPMYKLLEKVLKKLRIENAVWCAGENGQYYQVFFSVGSSDRCEEILRHLSDCEIGIKLNSVVSVIPCTLYYHGKDQQQFLDYSPSRETENEKFSMKTSAWDKFVQSVRARLTVAQVVEGVKANANLTFDFVILLLTSAFVAALGLVEDSTVTLVASMLISPLMGPIMAGMFGIVIGDKHLQKIGVLNELFCLLGCLIVGFVFGLVAGLTNEHWGNAAWPTEEMMSRGLVRALWVGLLIAIASGAALAIAILGDNTASMVGVAISASLLPPAVNAGLLWALSFIETVWKGRIELETEDMDPSVRTYTPVYSKSPAIELAILGAVSLCLTLINIVCIFITGIIILKIKEVAPRTSKDQEQFWKHDIKIARDYNRSFTGQDADDLKIRLAEGLACSEIQKTLQGLSPKMYNRFPSLGNHRSFLKPEELFRTGLVGYHSQQTWSPSTSNLLSESRPTIQDMENLYTTLAVNSTQPKQDRKRRHSGGIPRPADIEQNWSGVPSLTSTVSTSYNTVPGLMYIAESQSPWSVASMSNPASVSQKQSEIKAEYEKSLLYGTAPAIMPSNDMFTGVNQGLQRGPAGENLIKLDTVNLRDGKQMGIMNPNYNSPKASQGILAKGGNSSGVDIISMEKILEELLKKLEVKHIVWCNDKNGYFYQVFFPVGAGDPCENCLHCLTEMGIGKKYNSVVSVVPCTVYYEGLESTETDEENPLEKKAWNNFVQSIRSKLTVKSVVDGVRSGAECSFDYLLLVLTADMIAAVGLVESNSVNIVAAMLVSPLMSPIMAGTFGTAISDRKLQKIGIRSEIIGLFISLIFGFIFGLLVGTTQDPWGMGDWPTEEMKGRGMARSLWIGVLWALPSGTGVALALLQGSAGPLIGVAISASLLPPAVNCGIMWGLACTILIYDDVKIPHLKGEAYSGESKYVYAYSNWRPSEFAIMGVISFCLTLVNICCIFITAIVVLKIKEVAAPYTSSPDLRRFWEHDIRAVRAANRATLNQGRYSKGSSMNQVMQELGSVPPDELEHTLEAAVREAVDDDMFRKINRCSYSANTADVPRALGFGGHNNRASGSPLDDPEMLDHIIQALLDFQTKQSPSVPQRNSALNRFRQLSRSLRQGSIRSSRQSSIRRPQHGGGEGQGRMSTTGADGGLPTILETNSLKRSEPTRPQSLSDKNNTGARASVRSLIQGLANAQRRFSHTEYQNKDRSERISLTTNPL